MLAAELAYTDEDLIAELGDAEILSRTLERSVLEKSLYSYVKAAWHLVEPSPTPWLLEQPETFIDTWHLRVLCEQLERASRGELKRLIINVPPGTLKSLLVMVFFPTWIWAKKPGARFLCASHSAALSTRDNRRARQIVESPWYQARWPVVLLEDQNAKTRYHTADGGWRVAISVGGGIGEHPDYILIDDPETEAQAQSDVKRAAVNDWIDRTLSTRVGRDPFIGLIMQRLHQEDASGHLMEKGGWSRICWPMRYEASRPATEDDPGHAPDPLDERAREGELLCPKVLDEDAVRRQEVLLGEYGVAGQHQQRPAPKGGGLFKREWFQFVDAPPQNMRIVRGWDTAATEGDGCYTVGAQVGEEFATTIEGGKRSTKSTGKFYVLDVVRDQLSPAGVDALMRATAFRDGVKVAQREEREPGAAGVSQIAARRRLMRGFDYAEVPLSQNKVLRAQPFRSQAEGGNVVLVRGEWNRDFLDELCAFPTAKLKDQVDAVCTAFNCVSTLPEPKAQACTW